MQQINGKNENTDTSSIKIEQFTTVYHLELGKGHVVTVTYRRQNNLVMCFFPKNRTHEWIGEIELRSGMGDIALTRVTPRNQKDTVSDSLEDALRGLFNPR